MDNNTAIRGVAEVTRCRKFDAEHRPLRETGVLTPRGLSTRDLESFGAIFRGVEADGQGSSRPPMSLVGNGEFGLGAADDENAAKIAENAKRREVCSRRFSLTRVSFLVRFWTLSSPSRTRTYNKPVNRRFGKPCLLAQNHHNFQHNNTSLLVYKVERNRMWHIQKPRKFRMLGAVLRKFCGRTAEDISCGICRVPATRAGRSAEETGTAESARGESGLTAAAHCVPWECRAASSTGLPLFSLDALHGSGQHALCHVQDGAGVG